MIELWDKIEALADDTGYDEPDDLLDFVAAHGLVLMRGEHVRALIDALDQGRDFEEELNAVRSDLNDQDMP